MKRFVVFSDDRIFYDVYVNNRWIRGSYDKVRFTDWMISRGVFSTDEAVNIKFEKDYIYMGNSTGELRIRSTKSALKWVNDNLKT